MINVYYGGSDRDKDRFMFDMIAQQLPADIVMLVPDQFTLQAERNAFEYLNADALLDLEIMSRSSFTRRVVAQTGEPAGLPVNKYGRYMLLTSLMLHMKKEQETAGTSAGIFAPVMNKRSFITMLNDQISELKQYNITPDELKQMAGKFSDEDILSAKLTEICDIYARYEEAVAGRFTDSEDYLQAVIARIKDAPFIRRSIFWIDGFDYMTPKLFGMIEAIAASAVDVNVVLTGAPAEAGGLISEVAAGDGSCFAISRNMRSRLRGAADRCGVSFSEQEIPRKYAAEMRPRAALMSASDFYAEAESIAADITRLVRDEGYRYRDIAVICNDADKRGSVFRRVFDTYGIPLFMDKKRSVAQEPAIVFITSMLDIVHSGRRFDNVFTMLKTGFAPVSDDECEKLEKYCRKYNIKSGRWKRDFVYGLSDEGEERLAELNDIRRRTDELITQAEGLFSGVITVGERCGALYRFLAETADMPERCGEARERLEKEGLLDEAESTSQIWETVAGILDQFVEVLGDEELNDEDFNEILAEGFDEVEIGIIPTNNDQVIFGTMQRTRTGCVRALFVAGANDGVLPESGRTESLLSDDEKQLITDRLKRISKTDELRVMEQDLAIYKNLTKASDILTVSYADMDTDGAELRPSELAEAMRQAGVPLRRDYVSAGDADYLLQSPAAAAAHTASALRKYLSGEKLADAYRAAALALDGSRHFETAKKGLFYSSRIDHIKKEQVHGLFGRGSSGVLTVGTSGFERYSRCPFSFFVTYGLKPREERRFEADMRSVGDIYHECMRRIADELTDEDVQVCAPGSKWLSVTPSQCRSMTARFVDEFAERYREGLFELTGRETYIRERIKEICFDTAWLIIEQVRRGNVKAIYFEQRFARRADALFPPVEIDLGEDGSVFIEGIIDRIDIINGQGETGGSHNYIRVIDYKSGSEKFNLDEVKSGWRLQLMLYLKSAMGAVRDSRPAGVFYFAVKEPDVDVTSTPQSEMEQKISSSMLRNVRLDGALLNNESVITGMDSDITGTSDVIPVRRLASGAFSGSSLLSDAEFDELIKTNDENLYRSASAFASGCIDADPAVGKNTTACRYCMYHSICGRE